MGKDDVEDLRVRAHQRDNPYEAAQLKVYQNEMEKNEEQLWTQLETRYGALEHNQDYINTFNEKDNDKMREVCYKYFDVLREIRQR
eukprot:4841153-Amphidinium_carterae.3